MDNRYRLYLDAANTLAETIVIKSAAAAASINQRVVEEYGPIAVRDEDPNNWKYYMNLAGEYHPTNEVMTVVSMDTQTSIVFSKENLAIHRATARSYAYGTRQYTELVAKYPTQETLILGILYPVDKTTAIEAPDGTILGFPPGLVEPNEYNFVSKLQAWIWGYIYRWVVKGFTVTDSLYTATWMGIMYVNMVPAILTIRLAACKTNEAHSFHVKKYLASHGLNENHLEYLNLEQSLWLYRNIEYLQRNLGKQENFELLMQQLMTKRNLPLAEYTMRHDVQLMPTEIYPTVAFRKKTLNVETVDLIPTFLTLDKLLDKQDQFARANKTIKEDVAPVIKEIMENANSNVLMTKFLESTVVDYGDNTPYTMYNVLIHHWLHLATQGLYGAFITVTNPRTGERFPLNALDAFTLSWYAFWAARDYVLDEVPHVIARRVQRIPTPSVDDLLSVVDKTLVSREDAVEALSRQPAFTPIISTEAFYAKCLEIYHAEQHQRGLVSYQEHKEKHAMMQNMIARIYSDSECVLAPSGADYSTWLGQRNIDLSNFASADFAQMYEAIVLDATGLSLIAKVSIKDIQRAMVGLMTGLSSYSIQINAEVNGSDLMVSDTPAIRWGDIDQHGKDLVPLQEEIAVFSGAPTRGKNTEQYDINLPQNTNVTEVNNHVGTINYDIGLPLVLADRAWKMHVVYPIADVRFTLGVPVLENNLGVIAVPGIPEWLALPPDQRIDIIDMYDTGLPPVMPTPDDDPDDLANVISQNVLSGLHYGPEQLP